MILIAPPLQHQVKSFRNTLTSAAMSRIRSSLELSAAAWSRFWAMFLVFVQRNVPYRLLHQKVNARLQMSIYNSELYQASCLFCFQDTETIPHFFFLCHVKFSIWTQLIDKFLWPGTTVQGIQASLSPLNFEQIFAFLSVWTRSYSHHCHLRIIESSLVLCRWSNPFSSRKCFSATSAALKKRFAEDHLSDLQRFSLFCLWLPFLCLFRLVFFYIFCFLHVFLAILVEYRFHFSYC